MSTSAHHPVRFSNTYRFYQLGWRGINIDAMPGSMAAFRRYRPRDINLETGVSDRSGKTTFYVFDEPALNCFSESLATFYQQQNVRLVGVRELETVPLRQLLGQHLAENQTIDFMNVDVEGLDLEVLRSNDWQRFRPRVVLVELLGLENLDALAHSPAAMYLCEQGYQPIARLHHTVFFQRTGSGGA